MRRRTVIGPVLLGAALAAAQPLAAHAGDGPPVVEIAAKPKSRPGGLLDYAIIVRNGATRGVRLNVTLPGGMAIIGVTPRGCRETPTGMACHFADLEPGGRMAAKLAAIVKSKARGVQTATAEVTADTGATGRSTATTTIEQGVDLAVRLKAPRRAAAGQAFEMTARVVNRSRRPATNVRLQVGTERGHFVAVAGKCAEKRLQSRCELGRINPGRARILRFRVAIKAGAHGVIGNFAATASVGKGDTDPGNNVAVALVRITPQKAVPQQERMLPMTGADPRPTAAIAFALLTLGFLLMKVDG